jgi:hypothetical protein
MFKTEKLVSFIFFAAVGAFAIDQVGSGYTAQE